MSFFNSIIYFDCKVTNFRSKKANWHIAFDNSEQ